MKNRLTLTTTDAAQVTEAFDQVVTQVGARCRAASYVSAVRIKYEAQARVARRTSGEKTPSDPTGRGGRTAQGITVEPSRNHIGYVVVAKRPDMPHLPWWLEKGTEHMGARPFFWPSVQLEASAHERRIEDAINGAIATGLG